MINLVKFLIILASFNIYGQLPNFYSTRLLSSAGAGIGSILVDEASMLNPASIAFVPTTNFYYQRSNNDINESSSSRVKKSDSGLMEIYQMADSSGELKGTFSYQNRAQNGYKRRKLVSSFAAVVGKKTSVGLSYAYNKYTTPLAKEDTFHQGSIGITHIFNEKLSAGLIVNDPFSSNGVDSKVGLGFQFTLFKGLTFMQDFEYALKNDDATGISTRTALQINAFDDFYLRAGKSEDDIRKTTSVSYGLFWIGPKLSLGYAVMKSTFTENTTLYFRDEQDIESSFSVSIRI